MTKRQRELLDFIMYYMTDYHFSPTLREMQERFGWASSATAWEHLANLRYAGYIEWNHNESRSIRVLDPGRQQFVCRKCGGVSA